VLGALEPLAAPGAGAATPAALGGAAEGGFARSFDLFGGAEALDELADLSNQCSRVLNRARATLGPEKTAHMDATISRLAPLFDLGVGAEGGGGGGAGPAEEGEGEEEGGCDYGPVLALVSKAERKADLMHAELLAAAAEAEGRRLRKEEQQEGRGGSGGAVGGGGAAGGGAQATAPEIEPAGAAEGAAVQQQAEGPSAGAAEEGGPEWLALWRAAADRSLGEVCSGQVMLLLQDARSISALARWVCGDAQLSNAHWLAGERYMLGPACRRQAAHDAAGSW
jgi:hypothetical protein